MKTKATLDPSDIGEGRDATALCNEDETKEELEKNGTGESGAINDNGTLPTRVVSPIQCKGYADDGLENDDGNSKNKKMDSNFKRSEILLTKGESGSAVNEAIRDDDSMGDKTRKREVPSFQPNGDPKTLPALSLPEPVSSEEQQQRLPSPVLPQYSPSKVGVLFEDDEVESRGVHKKEANNESVEKCKGRYSRQFFAAFAANFGALALGTVLSWTSPALPDLRERKSVGEISVSDETWISTLSLLGAASACPIVGYGIERFGRKRCLLLLTLPFLGGWLLIILAQNIWMIYVGRFLSGFSGGGGSIAIPVYVTETASTNIRGMLASGFDMMVTVGILYIFVIGTFVAWQWQAVACGLLPIVFHLLMTLVPESPTFLVEQGKQSDASNALQWLRGASSQQVETELQELISSVNESKNKSASWKDLLKSPALKPTILAVSLMVFQQLAAIDAVMFYTVDIFASSGADVNENLSANIVGAIQVLATITAALVVDRVGRRVLLLISEVFMVISLGTMGLFFYLKKENRGETPEGLGMLPLASLMVYVAAFSIGMGPLPWLLMGELLPLHIKGKSSGIVTITRWILGFAVTFLFKYLMRTIDPHGCYWVFCAFCIIGTIFIYVFIPETNGKSLDEIQEYFKNKIKPQNSTTLCSSPDKNI